MTLEHAEGFAFGALFGSLLWCFVLAIADKFFGGNA